MRTVSKTQMTADHDPADCVLPSRLPMRSAGSLIAVAIALASLCVGGCTSGASKSDLDAGLVESPGYPSAYVDLDSTGINAPVLQQSMAQDGNTSAIGASTGARLTFGYLDLTLSSGRDAAFRGLVVSQGEHSVLIDEFSAISSVPITATGQAAAAQADLIAAVKSGDVEASRIAAEAWVNTIETVAPGALQIIGGLIP